MMRRCSPTYAYAVLLVLLMTSMCTAQPRGRRGFRSLPPENLVLISLPEVQHELEITSQQTKLIEALQADILAQLRTRADRETREKRNAVSSKLWSVVLEKEQAKRYSELKLQFRGLYAADDAEFTKDLELTESQQRKIRDLRADENPIEVAVALDGVLEATQIKQWQAKMGKSFEFTEDTLRFREYYLRQSRSRGSRTSRGSRPRPDSDDQD